MRSSSRRSTRQKGVPQSRPQLEVRPTSRVTRHPSAAQSRRSQLKAPVVKQTRTRTNNRNTANPSSKTNAAPPTESAAGQLVSNLQQQVKLLYSFFLFFSVVPTTFCTLLLMHHLSLHCHLQHQLPKYTHTFFFLFSYSTLTDLFLRNGNTISSQQSW